MAHETLIAQLDEQRRKVDFDTYNIDIRKNMCYKNHTLRWDSPHPVHFTYNIGGYYD